MNYQHKNLASGRWRALSFVEQMANIASEVERTLNWKAKHNDVYSQRAFERTLELMDLTVETARGYPKLKELCRLREVLVDYFLGENQFKFNETALRKYFSNFTYAARRNY
ncbi:MAG: hypothetical protein PHQ96_05900 [Candidatus Omnitrophica bacterium]|nr:hypothetical protein [Candidatus Omnitrophota bacterium]